MRHRLGLLLLVCAVACSSGGNATPNPAFCASLLSRANFGAASLRVEIAGDNASRAKGLMGVASLPPNQGMAFVWDAPTEGTFWMKDTLIPLSIAFVGQDGRVVTIRDMSPCEADPCTTYAATAPYTWAVEANAGWFERHGVEVGDEASLRYAMCS